MTRWVLRTFPGMDINLTPAPDHSDDVLGLSPWNVIPSLQQAPIPVATPSSLLLSVLETPLPAWADSFARQIARMTTAESPAAAADLDYNELAEVLFLRARRENPTERRHLQRALAGAALRHLKGWPILVRPAQKPGHPYKELPGHYSVWQPRAYDTGRWCQTLVAPHPQPLPDVVVDALLALDCDLDD